MDVGFVKNIQKIKPKKPNPAVDHSPRTMMIGIILTILGGALWGTNATVSKILMSQYLVSPLQIACVRQLAAGVLFVIVASIVNRKQLVDALSTKKIMANASCNRYCVCAFNASGVSFYN